MGKLGFQGSMVKNWGFGGKMEVLMGFDEKIVGFSENEVFVGFWSIDWEKVEKSREFDDFLKIEEIREK